MITRQYGVHQFERFATSVRFRSPKPAAMVQVVGSALTVSPIAFVSIVHRFHAVSHSVFQDEFVPAIAEDSFPPADDGRDLRIFCLEDADIRGDHEIATWLDAFVVAKPRARISREHSRPPTWGSSEFTLPVFYKERSCALPLA